MTATRYLCPLNCGWHHDQPGIDPTNPSTLHLAADVPVPEGVDPVVFRLMAGNLLTIEDIVRKHLETHELLEWVQAVSQLTAAVQRVRVKAAEWSELAPPDDWGMTPGDTVLADAGRYLLALVDQPERIPTPQEQS